MRMKLIAAVFMLALCRLPVAAAQPVDQGTAAVFFQNMNDVPLMPGLEEMADEAVLFDKPEGRIAEFAAVTRTLGERAIKDFYDDALPQFGWRSGEGGVFTRQNEVLRMGISWPSGSGARIVRFRISPQ